MTEINDMIPFEREIYIALTNQKQEEEAKERENR